MAAAAAARACLNVKSRPAYSLGARLCTSTRSSLGSKSSGSSASSTTTSLDSSLKSSASCSGFRVHCVRMAAAAVAGASSKRFAVLVTGHTSDYTKQRYGDHGPLFERLLRDTNDEEWTYYNVCDDEVPSADQLAELDGVVVTGSKFDAHGTDPWMLRLREVLRDLHARQQRMLGVCFGHQIMSNALGGASGRAPVGWEIGIKHITATPAAADKPYWQDMPMRFNILESHQDQVLVLPPEANSLAQSASTSYEMYSIGNHILCMQGHPEYNKDIINDILEVRAKAGIIPAAVVEAARESLLKYEPDEKPLTSLCRRFLKGAA